MYALRSGILAVALVFGAGSVSCVGSAEVRAVAHGPRLVWIAPGVWVVEDYSDAVFFYDGFYWMYADGFWYRSDYYTSGFVRVSFVPPTIVAIHRPHRYSHYRAPRGAKVRVIDRRRQRPAVRDHRAPPPKTRDHRAPPPKRRDNRRKR